MIRSLTTAQDRQQFLSAARRDPLLHAVLGRDLTLWADNPGAPTRLFVSGQAALSITDRLAWLSGLPQDPEELGLFLRFAGVQTLLTAQHLDRWPGLAFAGKDCAFVLEPGQFLAQPPLPPGYTLDRQVPVSQAAQLLFPVADGYRDGFYSRTCTAVNHGLARLWGLRDGQNRLLATMGADALFEGQAYLSLLHTHPAHRRRGLGGFLVSAMANELSAGGWQSLFFSESPNLNFYRQLGFVSRQSLRRYRILTTTE